MSWLPSRLRVRILSSASDLGLKNSTLTMADITDIGLTSESWGTCWYSVWLTCRNPLCPQNHRLQDMLDSLTLDDVLECGQQTQELVRLVCSLSCKEMRAVVSTIFSNKLKNSTELCRGSDWIFYQRNMSGAVRWFTCVSLPALVEAAPSVMASARNSELLGEGNLL